MTQARISARLGDIADVQSGGTPSISNKVFWDGEIPWYTSGELNSAFTTSSERRISAAGIAGSNAKLFPAGSLLIGMYDTAAMKMSILDRDAAFNQAIAGVKPNEAINMRFVFYALSAVKDELLDQRRGVRQKNLSLEKVRDFPIPQISMIEQDRIVAILDEAFEGIATAKANAEKNLRNVRELFESTLDAALSRHDGGYVETTLGDQIDLLAGYAFPSKGYTDAANGIRLLRGDNIMQGYLRWDHAKGWPAHDVAPYARFVLQEGDVVLAMDRPWVKAGLKRAQIGADDLPCLQLQRTARLRPRRGMSVDFLYHLTGSKSFSRHLLDVQTGLGVPHISGKQIESFRFMLPPPDEQEIIACTLHDLQQRVERLDEICKRKLALLDELKRSLLDQAFTGQLSSPKHTRIAKQSALPTTTPEFAANVIALAHARHERQKREKTFGRVKEQKVLHLVESIAKVDLGRQPMRDAAGPNDFRHMLKAEAWAKDHKFFEMVKRGEGYEFRKLGTFDERLSSARQALAPCLQQLEGVIDLLVPMDTVDAEVFATVHAAWNNLLIDGAAATDDAIVSAAREGWHADKLRIPEHKFRTAIASIRQKGLVPDGTGKYVSGQQSLL